MADKSMSQVELGKKSDILAQNIYKYLHKKRSPSLEVIDRLALALEVNVDMLLGENKEAKVGNLTKDDVYESVHKAAHTNFLKLTFPGLTLSKTKELAKVVDNLGGWEDVFELLKEEVTLRKFGEEKFKTVRNRLLEQAEEVALQKKRKVK